MNKSLFFTTLAAGGIALAMAACDQQDATENSTVPMQQQGAMPSDNQGSTPLAPESSAPEAMEPESSDSESMTPDSDAPATSQ